MLLWVATFVLIPQQYKAKKEESGLHIIIFDELDAICKQRGTASGSTGVGDTVVNQLLSKVSYNFPLENARTPDE